MKSPITVVNEPLGKIDRIKQAPELQFHAAATLIVHGDPFSLDPTKRADRAGEIAQFCVPIPSKFVGRLKRHHIDEAFENLKLSILERLRSHGVMAQGE